MTKRTAIVADEEILKKYDPESICTQHNKDIDINLITPNKSLNLLFKGWNFTSKHTKILDTLELEALTARIGESVECYENEFINNELNNHELKIEKSNINSVGDMADRLIINEHHLHLPPLIFGHDIMNISRSKHTLENNTENIHNHIFSFDGGDALTCWASQHSKRRINGLSIPLNVIQVPYAKSWTQRQEEVENCSGDITAIDSNIFTKITTNNKVTCEITSPSKVYTPWDWTFSSDYCFTWKKDNILNNYDNFNNQMLKSTQLCLNEDTSIPIIISANDLSSPSINDISTTGWRREESSGIDFNLLRETNQPILFFDESVLYSDDLEDCGEVSMEVKIRVMPSCWFVLNRLFLRVDGTIARIRDVRLFHKFGDNQIHMEITWKEQHLSKSLLPLAVLRNPNALAEIMPYANNSTHRFFSLDLS